MEQQARKAAAALGRSIGPDPAPRRAPCDTASLPRIIISFSPAATPRGLPSIPFHSSSPWPPRSPAETGSAAVFAGRQGLAVAGFNSGPHHGRRIMPAPGRGPIGPSARVSAAPGGNDSGARCHAAFARNRGSSWVLLPSCGVCRMLCLLARAVYGRLRGTLALFCSLIDVC